MIKITREISYKIKFKNMLTDILINDILLLVSERETKKSENVLTE